jgi:hypothetical protein
LTRKMIITETILNKKTSQNREVSVGPQGLEP